MRGDKWLAGDGLVLGYWVCGEALAPRAGVLVYQVDSVG